MLADDGLPVFDDGDCCWVWDQELGAEGPTPDAQGPICGVKGPVSWNAVSIMYKAGAVSGDTVLRHVACKQLSGHTIQHIHRLHASRHGGSGAQEAIRHGGHVGRKEKAVAADGGTDTTNEHAAKDTSQHMVDSQRMVNSLQSGDASTTHAQDMMKKDSNHAAATAAKAQSPPAPAARQVPEREVAYWRSKGTPECKCGYPTCIVQATSKEQRGRFIVKCLLRYKVPTMVLYCRCFVAYTRTMPTSTTQQQHTMHQNPHHILHTTCYL